MKLLVISLCTQGIMREHFIYYCQRFAVENELYCITNDNVSNDELGAIKTLNVHYSRTNPFGYFSIGKLWKMRMFIHKVNPDIVYIFTHHASSILIAPVVRRYKLIYQVHDPIPHHGIGWLNAWIIRTQLKIYAKLADRLVVAGEAVKQQVLENCRADAAGIEVIPLAVLDNYIRDDLKPVEKKVDLLFFGRIEQYKGLDTLISALGRMDDAPSVYIIGGGDILKVYENIQDVPKNVYLLGYLENEELIKYIKACRAVVLPYHEASGTMTVGQAFYYGKPVIASDVGVLPEYVGDGGLVFQHGDAEQLSKCIGKILEDDALRDRFSEAAKILYQEKFTISRACASHQKVFESLLAD